MGDSTRRPGALARRLALVLLGATFAALGLKAVDATVGLPLPGFLAGIWAWHYVAIEFAAAAVCGLRAVAERRERLAWSIIALGIVSYGCADLYWDVVLENMSAIPYPSAADGMYLAFYPAAYVGLVLLLRARGGNFPASVWLDGAIGAAGLGAAVGTFLFPIVIDTTGGHTATVVTNGAYPVVDLALLGLVACVIGAMRGRVDWSWSLLASGFALFAVADTFYLYQTARGTYVTDQWLDLGWPGGMTLVAFASTRPGHRLRAAPFVRWPALVVPAAFGAISLGLLVYDHFSRVNTVAVLLAAGTVALVIVRLALTFAEYLRAIARSHEEAVSDPLTGLGNRRALAAALERALSSQRAHHALVLFDLDGFKSYNDTFGHPAGDALLERSARALSAAPHGGSAYRMGGDEFCLLAPLPEGARRSQAQAIAELGARALHAKGEFFEIGSSHGVVVLPDEAVTATDAIRLADQRMYAQKGTGRRTATGAAVDTLMRAMGERQDDLSEHGTDVEDLAHDLAVTLRLPAQEREYIRQAAALHDVGKLAIPDSILQKPGPLDEAELQFMRRHTEIGARILGDEPSVAPIAALIRASHEYWDGSGYPDRTAEADIPLGARIIAICDAYHAMVTARPYDAAGTPEDAVAELRRCAGTQFDPELVEPFVRLLEQRLAYRGHSLDLAA
jgi:two-component system, cell cycle response regulator